MISSDDHMREYRRERRKQTVMKIRNFVMVGSGIVVAGWLAISFVAVWEGHGELLIMLWLYYTLFIYWLSRTEFDYWIHDSLSEFRAGATAVSLLLGFTLLFSAHDNLMDKYGKRYVEGYWVETYTAVHEDGEYEARKIHTDHWYTTVLVRAASAAVAILVFVLPGFTAFRCTRMMKRDERRRARNREYEKQREERLLRSGTT
ncbi:MAG: hypothetical protein ACKVU1_00645 [bacterium]